MPIIQQVSVPDIESTVVPEASAGYWAWTRVVWVFLKYTFVLLTEWAVRKANKLVKIWECAINVVRAVGEILQAIKELLWKIGNFFGQLGLLILTIMELIFDRHPEEAEYRMVTEGEELEDIEGAGVAGEEEDE